MVFALPGSQADRPPVSSTAPLVTPSSSSVRRMVPPASRGDDVLARLRGQLVVISVDQGHYRHLRHVVVAFIGRPYRPAPSGARADGGSGDQLAQASTAPGLRWEEVEVGHGRQALRAQQINPGGLVVVPLELEQIPGSKPGFLRDGPAADRDADRCRSKQDADQVQVHARRGLHPPYHVRKQAHRPLAAHPVNGYGGADHRRSPLVEQSRWPRRPDRACRTVPGGRSTGQRAARRSRSRLPSAGPEAVAGSTARYWTSDDLPLNITSIPDPAGPGLPTRHCRERAPSVSAGRRGPGATPGPTPRLPSALPSTAPNARPGSLARMACPR